MNVKMKGALILGLVLVVMVAALCVLPAFAAVNGDADQTRDRTHDRTQDRDCSCDCVKDQFQTRTRLQIRDC